MEISNREARFMIKQYISMGETIEWLKEQKNAVSEYFYVSRSMVGSHCFDRDSLYSFQHTMQPEAAVIKILAREEAIQKRIDRLQVRYERFNEVTKDIKKPNISPYTADLPLDENEQFILGYIQEIEQDIRKPDIEEDTTDPAKIETYDEEEGGNIFDFIDKVMEATM